MSSITAKVPPLVDGPDVDTITCDGCSLQCSDFRARDGKRICLLCVEGELDAVRLELASTSRRLAEEQLTLADFDRVVRKHGFDAEAGEYDPDWIDRALTELALLRAVDRGRYG